MSQNPVAAGLSFLTLCGLCGCKTLEPSAETQLEVPVEFTASRSISPRAATGWLDDFRDRKLTSLVDEAMRYNNDLAVSAARLQAARADVQIATAPLLPQLGGDAGATRRKIVRDEIVQPPAPAPTPAPATPAAMPTAATMGTTPRSGAGMSTSTPMVPAPPPVTRIVDNYAEDYDIGANLRWEIDLWGKLINRRRASSADLRAASADHHGFKLTLAANVARAWFNAAEAELQVQLSQSTVESLEKNLRFVDRGVDLGTSEPLDFRLTRANLENSRGNLEARKQVRRFDCGRRGSPLEYSARADMPFHER
jgi:multidrug efflux system outer membrane protein